VFLLKLGIADSIFLKQSLPELFMIFAMYVVYLGLGHTLLCKTIKSGTISLYVRAASNRMMDRRQRYSQTFPKANLTWFHPCRKHGSTTIAPEIQTCILEIKRWENMPDRREPLTTDMIQYQKLQCSSATPHSLNQALYDWFVTGIYAGFRLSEWAQDDHVRTRLQVKQTIDGDPTAFLIGDIEFYGENRRRMSRGEALRRPYTVFTIDCRWRYQKNGKKCEKKTFTRIGRGHDAILCGVSAWLRIVHRWSVLQLDALHPLAVFTSSGLENGSIDFIRPMHINAALREAATKVYNITDPKELARFSSHSIRVGACVALHAAGVSKMDIKFALRWKSDSFYTYLRNLPCQSAKTAAAVLNFSPHRFTLVPTNQVA
jgi:hypothetical protein